MGFPIIRTRRSRQASWSRLLVAENILSVNDLILPVFVHEEKESKAIQGFSGVLRHSCDDLCRVAEQASTFGIPALAIFPVVSEEKKCPTGQEALRQDNLISRAIKAVKKTGYTGGVIADVALDPYTSHGHDGLIKDGDVCNDATLKQLSAQAEVLMAAGADVLAPSDMMDGRVKVLRELCEQLGQPNQLILSYAAKYASGFYGPFRSAVGSGSALGFADKKTYQQDFANSDEAVRECLLDVAEGADWLMIKPGMPYLDILQRVSNAVHVPVFAYQVSGEYQMIQLLAQQSEVDALNLHYEALLAFKRAGGTAVLTYAALDMAKRLVSL